MVKKKQPPPAKIKYDKSHPIVSIRVSEDLKKQLDEIREMMFVLWRGYNYRYHR